MDWSLRSCGRRGHVTFAPTEPDIHARLRTETALGEAWRCLRCGTFVLGEPGASGPAADAPLVLRGAALREAFVLRLLAAERAIRTVVFALLGYAVLRFESSQTSLQQLFDKVLPAAKPLAHLFNFDLDKSPTIAHLRHLLHSTPSTLHLVAAALIGYAVIEAVEAVGLWSLKRWGEYIAVVATSVFLPLEVYELSRHATWLKIVAFVVNLALVAYLLLAKRLFGLRGGSAAYAAARHELSFLEVEAASVPADTHPQESAPAVL